MKSRVVAYANALLAFDQLISQTMKHVHDLKWRRDVYDDYHFLQLKTEIICRILHRLPLGPDYLSFCANVSNCQECEYGLKHGICDSSQSLYYVILEMKDNLCELIVQYSEANPNREKILQIASNLENLASTLKQVSHRIALINIYNS